MKEGDILGGMLVVMLIIFMIGFVQGDVVEGWIESLCLAW